jgi:hypothetical protein
MTTAEHKAIDQAHDDAKLRRQIVAATTAAGMMIRRADCKIEQGDEAIKKFALDLQGNNPTYALEWSHGVMNATAARDVAIDIKKAIESIGTGTYTMWSLRDVVTDKVISSARHPSFSTSPTSNLMDQFRNAAFADWVGLLNDAVQHLEANGLKRPKSTTDEA